MVRLSSKSSVSSLLTMAIAKKLLSGYKVCVIGTWSGTDNMVFRVNGIDTQILLFQPGPNNTAMIDRFVQSFRDGSGLSVHSTLHWDYGSSCFVMMPRVSSDVFTFVSGFLNTGAFTAVKGIFFSSGSSINKC